MTRQNLRVGAWSAAIGCAMLLWTGGTAFAQSATDKDGDGVPDEEAARLWSISASISTQVGQGTFANVSNDSEFADEVGEGGNAFDQVVNRYSINPAMLIEGGKYSLTLGFSWTHALTARAAPFSFANEPNEVRFGDISLTGNYNKGFVIKKTGTRFIPSLTLSAPTSRLNQRASQIVDTSGSIAAVQRLFDGHFTLLYVTVGGKTFHRRKTPSIDTSQVGPANALYRESGPENLGDGLIAAEGYNFEYYWINLFGINVPVWKFLLRIRYRFDNFWTYNRSNDDEFTSEFGDVGRGHVQLARSSVSLQYGVTPWLALTGGISSIMSPKTSDQATFRFPFWNMNGAANNASTIFLSATLIY